MSINWPDMKFPPVNLYSAPRMSWPKGYLDLEHKYCEKEEDNFYAEIDGTLQKEYLRLLVKEKREEFNKLWNARGA